MSPIEKLGVGVAVVMGLSLWVWYSGNHPRPLSAEAIDSVVSDVETRRPVQGAIVVAYWEVKQGSMGGDSLPCAAANVEEAVTDAHGRFHIPAWGPVPPICATGPRHPYLQVFIYKQGYYYGKSGDVQSYPATDASPSWDQQLHLKKIPDTELMQTDLKDVDSAMSNVDQLGVELSMFTLDMAPQCNWRKMPNMMRALELQRRWIRQTLLVEMNGLTGNLIAHDEEFMKMAPQCGSVRGFIEGLMK
jgi:hypothetical protein